MRCKVLWTQCVVILQIRRYRNYSSAYYYANQRLIIAQYVVKHHWRFLLIAQDHNIVLSFAQQRPPNWLCALSQLINLWRKTTVIRTFVFVLFLYSTMFILENKLNYYYKFVEFMKFMKFMRNISKLIQVSIVWIWF